MRVTDNEEWYAVTRTWYVRATNWYEATQVTKRNGQEDDLRITRHGQYDPRRALPSAPQDDDAYVDWPKALAVMKKLYYESGHTARSLGRAAQISHTSVHNYLNGKVQRPRYGTASRILAALGADPLTFTSGGGGDRTRVNGV